MGRFGSIGLTSALFIATWMFLPTAAAQPVCTIVADCAEIAAKAAQQAQAAASALTTRLVAAEREIAALKAQSIVQVNVSQPRAASSASYGGASAVTPVAQCPAGQVAVGIEMTLGGTCHEQCNADGRTVSSFRLVCATPMVAR